MTAVVPGLPARPAEVRPAAERRRRVLSYRGIHRALLARA